MCCSFLEKENGIFWDLSVNEKYWINSAIFVDALPRLCDWSSGAAVFQRLGLLCDLDCLGRFLLDLGGLHLPKSFTFTRGCLLVEQQEYKTKANSHTEPTTYVPTPKMASRRARTKDKSNLDLIFCCRREKRMPALPTTKATCRNFCAARITLSTLDKSVNTHW